MLNISNLTFLELEQLSNFFVSIGCVKESDEVLNYLTEELSIAQNEAELNALENQVY